MRLLAFLCGMREFRLTCTWADPNRTDGNSYTALDEAYDWGREWAHCLTFRYFEP